ncbi:bactofilin family protein [Shewanella acanthi]|uniref:bactofilin family protein n=1 Tax=Shewanella acanthi TaxID=2864212 RepID=UPI001C66101B|nr:polymer-forming cytoskeletal protein [Shewanella acanthi]QYJ77790.1 polymer-forming cytoskeletal protein [Shewanella acanthi]
MFAKKLFSSSKSTPALSYIANGTTLSGQMEFSGDVLIGGDVSGQILSQANVVIEQTGKVKAEIKCHEFIVNGYFKGRLICDRIIIQHNGIVDGEVASTHMQILSGGQFIGRRIKEDSNTIRTHVLPSLDTPPQVLPQDPANR